MSTRINKFIAQASGLSRRKADQLIKEGRVLINQRVALVGDLVTTEAKVTVDGQGLAYQNQKLTIMLNKPVGYVSSRVGQGSQTIYDLLPADYHVLKPVGRLDKDSSGLILLTNDGELANQLTHPAQQKEKIYLVSLNKQLETKDQLQINRGVKLSDGPSQLKLSRLANLKQWQVSMHEGRNRQIRRSFDALGYKVIRLHRIQLGKYHLGSLGTGQYKQL